MNQVKKGEKLLRLNDVLERLPISKSTWLYGVKNGYYPQPIKLGVRTIAWRESNIDSIVENGIKEFGSKS